MVGPDNSCAWLGLMALAAFIACGLITGYTLVEYELEARQVRQTMGSHMSAADLLWLDLTATPD